MRGEWMGIENEKKFKFKDKKVLEKVIHSNNVKESVGILQWFIEINEKFYRRIRLEIFREKESYRHVWTYCEKRKINDSNEKRDEHEFTLDMESPEIKEGLTKNTNDENEKLRKKVSRIKQNISTLKDEPAIFK